MTSGVHYGMIKTVKEDNKIIIEKINKEQENGTGEQEYNDK